jgi:hypothetical protein
VHRPESDASHAFGTAAAAMAETLGWRHVDAGDR